MLVSLKNNLAEIGFALNDGIFALNTLRHGSDEQFACGNVPLWKIELLDRDGGITELISDSMPETELLDRTLFMRWLCGEYCRVTVSVEKSGEDAFELRIAVDQLAGSYSVREVHFPHFVWQLTDGEACKLILPEDAGTVYPDPLKTLEIGKSHLFVPRLQSRHYPHGNFCMQFFALEKNGILAYCGAHDPAALVKAFCLGCDRENKVLTVSPHWHCPDTPGVEVKSFPWVLALNEGDWFDAAQRYRKFALTAPWTANGALEHGKKSPQWLLETPMIPLRMHRGVGHQAEDLIADAEYFGVPQMIHYYMSQKASFDSNLPFFFPVVPDFHSELKKLKDAGIKVIPYLNFFSADMNQPDWDYLKDSAVQINEKGDIHAQEWSCNGHVLVEMCPSSPCWRRITSLVGMRMLETDVAGVYFDEIGMSPAYTCCAGNHGHIPGNPEQFCASWNTLIGGMKAETAEFKDVPVFASEGGGEPLMGNVDTLLVGNNNSPYTKPLFSAVYHDYVMCYGRYTFAQELDDPAFAGAIESKHAEQFVMGMQFGWSRIPWSVIRTAAPQIAEFVRDMALAWSDHSIYLAAGKMLRPLTLDVPEKKVRWARAWNDMTGTEFTMPAVLNSVWQCDNASIAVVLVNISDCEQKFEVVMPSIQMGDKVSSGSGAANYRYPLPQASQAFQYNYHNGRQPRIVPGGDSTNGFHINMPPRTTAVLLISSEKCYGVHQ